ncbi:hypothetical protein [Streptosporangium sp. NPDC000396]|uniref:hypothetical protein n=1 Tax=Streptosporangium sp. NPDC000396 TaxID=3366185 RepID=UPI0036C61969
MTGLLLFGGSSQSAHVSTPHRADVANAPPDGRWHLTGDTGGEGEDQQIVATGKNQAWVIADEMAAYWWMMRWDGAAWTRGPGPHGLRDWDPAVLKAATSNGKAWLFGHDYHSETVQFLRFTGRRWQKASRLTSPPADGLYDAAIVDENDIWFSEGDKRLLWHWNGRRWRSVKAPTERVRLAAAGPEDLWALSSTTGQPVMMRWHHGRWSRAALPHIDLPAATDSCPEPHPILMTDLAALARDDVWAIGTVRHSAGAGDAWCRPLADVVLHWDGTTWKRVNLGLKGAHLEHLSADTASGVWASARPGSGPGYLINLRDGGKITMTVPHHHVEHELERAASKHARLS